MRIPSYEITEYQRPHGLVHRITFEDGMMLEQFGPKEKTSTTKIAELYIDRVVHDRFNKIKAQIGEQVRQQLSMDIEATQFNINIELFDGN